MQLSDVTPKLKNQLSRLIRTEVKNLMRAEAEAMKTHALSREQQRQEAEDRRRIEFYDGNPLSELIADQLCLVRSAAVSDEDVSLRRSSELPPESDLCVAPMICIEVSGSPDSSASWVSAAEMFASWAVLYLTGSTRVVSVAVPKAL